MSLAILGFSCLSVRSLEMTKFHLFLLWMTFLSLVSDNTSTMCSLFLSPTKHIDGPHKSRLFYAFYLAECCKQRTKYVKYAVFLPVD